MHPELERVVTEAAYACSWIPAKQHGILTDGAVRIPINFTLSMSQKSKNPAGRVFNKAGYADLPEGVIEYVWPSYPYMARLNDYDGEGWYQLQIDRDTGRVTDVIILKSTTHKVLDDAAITAFRKWRFRPHTSQSVILPATFFLQGRKLGEARRLAVYAPEPEHPVTRHSGVGTYRFIVDYNTGTVKDVQVIRSSGRKTFDAAVVKAYRQWRFLPHKIHSVDTTVGFGL
jgi:TonB family protein